MNNYNKLENAKKQLIGCKQYLLNYDGEKINSKKVICMIDQILKTLE